MELNCSQYIFTSWKNGGRGGGFTTFAKSRDVSSDESDAIRNRLNYVKPNELKDISDTSVFPVKYAYFRLPSGRYALARSVFIGQDYATPRWGVNYLIHALIFDDIDGSVPGAFVGAPFFKNGLTEQERENDGMTWADALTLDDASPEFSGKDAFEKICGSEDGARLLELMQAALENRHAEIYGVNSRLAALWIRAFCFAAPRNIAHSLTFGTYINMINPEYRLNFINEFTKFDPSRHVSQDGWFVFSPSQPCGYEPGVYLKEFCEKFSSDPESAVRFKESVEKTMEIIGVTDPDNAVDAAHFIEADVSYFTGKPELLKRLGLQIVSNPKIPDAAKTVSYMIYNSDLAEEEKTAYLCNKEISDRLPKHERDRLFESRYHDIFKRSYSPESFIRDCRQVSAHDGTAPLYYGFYRRYTEGSGTEKDKAAKIISCLGETCYAGFDPELKNYYTDLLVKEYYKKVQGSANASGALLKLNGLCQKKAADAVEKTLDDFPAAFKDGDFACKALNLIKHKPDLFYRVFRAAYNSVPYDPKEFIRKCGGSVDGFFDIVLKAGGKYIQYPNNRIILKDVAAVRFTTAVRTPEEAASFFNRYADEEDPDKTVLRHLEKVFNDHGKGDSASRLNAVLDFIDKIDAESACPALLEAVYGYIEKGKLTGGDNMTADRVVRTVPDMAKWRGFEGNEAKYKYIACISDYSRIKSNRNIGKCFYLKKGSESAQDPDFIGYVLPPLNDLFAKGGLEDAEYEKYALPLTLRADVFCKSLVDSAGDQASRGGFTLIRWMILHTESGFGSVTPESFESQAVFPAVKRLKKGFTRFYKSLGGKDKELYLCVNEYCDTVRFNPFTGEAYKVKPKERKTEKSAVKDKKSDKEDKNDGGKGGNGGKNEEE